MQAIEITMFSKKLPYFYTGIKAMLRHNWINADCCRKQFQNLMKSEK